MPPTFSLVLAFVAGLTLLMPVDYRAGTDQAHAHATFQIWIDAAPGRSHHHHGDAEHHHQGQVITVVSIPTPFVPARDVSHAAHTSTVHGTPVIHQDHDHGVPGVEIVVGDAPVSKQPDVPEPVTTYMPIQHANVLGALGTLIALLSAGTVRRPFWTRDRRLTGVVRLVDPPPPRPTPC